MEWKVFLRLGSLKCLAAALRRLDSLSLFDDCFMPFAKRFSRVLLPLMVLPSSFFMRKNTSTMGQRSSFLERIRLSRIPRTNLPLLLSETNTESLLRVKLFCPGAFPKNTGKNQG